MKINKLFILATILLGFQSVNAQFYWVGNSGSWSDYEHHWATTSGGNTFHDTIPGQMDKVIFDENSFTMDDQVVVSNQDVGIQSMEWKNVTHQPTFDANDHGFYIYGSILLQEDVNYNFRILYFKSQHTGETIKTNHAYLGKDVYFGISCTGEYSLQNDISVNTIFYDGGTFHTNGYNITASGNINMHNTNGHIYLGNSQIHCTSWMDNGINEKFHADSSTIYITNLLRLKQDNFDYVHYHNLVLQNSTKISGKGNFNEIFVDVTAPEAQITFYNQSHLKSNHFSSNSSKVLPLSMYCKQGFGTIEQASGTVNIAYATLENIHAIGGATFNANPGIDNGNNDGWNFTAITPQNYYWVNNGGNWSDLNHWAMSSGGTNKYTSLPTQFDNIIFDANSITAPHQNITIDTTTVVHSFTTQNVNYQPDLLASISIGVVVYGDLDLTGVKANIKKLTIKPADENNISFASEKISQIFLEGNGTYNLQTDVLCGYINLKHGSLVTHDFAINATGGVTVQGGTTLLLGTSQVNTKTFDVNTYDGPVTMSATDSYIHVTNNFYGANFAYNHVVLDKNVVIKGNNTFNTLELLPGTVAKFEKGKNQTILNEIIANGTSEHYITIKSTTNGQQSTWTKTSGDVVVKHVNIQDNVATGGANFTANQSIDEGNNTGWNILEPSPRDFYWVGNGGNWEDLAHWATTSGGGTKYDELPGQIDNIFFDENSFSIDGQKVVTNNDIFIHNMDWTSVNHSPSFRNQDGRVHIYGSCLMNDQVESNINQLVILGTEDHHLTGGKSNQLGTQTLVYLESSGAVSIDTPMNFNSLYFKNGTLNTNGYPIEVSQRVSFSSKNPKIFNLGESVLSTKDFKWQGYGDSLTIHGENATVICQGDFELNHIATVKATTVNLRKLQFENTNLSSLLYATMSIDTLALSKGKELQIKPKAMVTIQNLDANGTEDAPIFIHSSENLVQASIFKTEGTAKGTHLKLKDLIGAGGAEFIAMNSTDLGNVDGWNFTTSSAEEIEYEDLAIFPNPVREFIQVEMPNTDYGTYKIFDLQGRLLKEKHFMGQSQLKIDMKPFEKGVYWIIVSVGETRFQGKIIKK